MLERRKILQALAALPMVGDKILTNHTQSTMDGLLNSVPSYVRFDGCVENPECAKSNPLEALLGKNYYTIANKLRGRLEDDIKISRFLRGAGGHDADIEALRSTSRSYRNLKQRTRDQESFRLLQRWKDAQNNDWMNDSKGEDDF